VAKLPAPDTTTIRETDPQWAHENRPLFRLHTPRSQHPLQWNELRHYGPLTHARYDPWQPPPRHHRIGVGYFGFSLPTCLAEVFQTSRRITSITSNHQLSVIMPTRTLWLLDLRGNYPISVGASHSINGGRRSDCRKWAHAFASIFWPLDGLLYTGMAGNDCATLYSPALSAFPTHPQFSKPLSDAGLATRLADAAHQINYRLDA